MCCVDYPLAESLEKLAMGVEAMLEGTRKIESDADLVRPPRAAGVTRRPRAKSRKDIAAPVKEETPPERDIILRLIELIKQV
jgi:hypothetical protein